MCYYSPQNRIAIAYFTEDCTQQFATCYCHEHSRVYFEAAITVDLLFDLSIGMSDFMWAKRCIALVFDIFMNQVDKGFATRIICKPSKNAEGFGQIYLGLATPF